MSELQLGEGWQRPTITARDVPHIHRGWRGVWDFFWATLRKRPIPHVLEDVTFSVYVKPTAPSEIETRIERSSLVWGGQLEKAPAEIVTKEMIYAGQNALMQWHTDENPFSQECVKLVYLAMVAAKGKP